VTREHKLALIVGFSLVLIVGVLISDHFSPARTQDVSAGAMSAGTPVRFGSSADGLRIPAEPTSRTQMPDAVAAVHTAAPLPEQPTFRPPAPTSPQATAAAGSGLSGENARSPAPFSGQATETVMGSVPSDPPMPEQLRSQFERATGIIGERLAQAGTAGTGSTPTVPDAVLIKPIDQPALPIPGPTKPYSAGAMKRYTIEEGDSIYRITLNQYGDGTLWNRLREFNPGKIGADGQMRDGVVIDLPPRDVLLGQAVLPPPGARPNGQTPGSPRNGPAKLDPPQRRDAPPGFTIYVVQRGDELGKVAKKTLGSVKRWREIAAINTDIMPDPDSLAAGMKLRIPAR